MTKLRQAIAVAACCLAVAACTFRGTTESASDTVKDVTISTSGKTWFTPDGLVRDDQRLTAFVTLNFENLKQQMSQGQGEYVQSLSALLRIREDRRADFASWVQAHYAGLVHAETTPAALIASLDHALAVSR
jgi:hypothetical protein